MPRHYLENYTCNICKEKYEGNCLEGEYIGILSFNRILKLEKNNSNELHSKIFIIKSWYNYVTCFGFQSCCRTPLMVLGDPEKTPVSFLFSSCPRSLNANGLAQNLLCFGSGEEKEGGMIL